MYADKNYYYLVTPGSGIAFNLQHAFTILRVVIDGTNGRVWEIRRVNNLDHRN
jgi:hypothetical protein